MIDILKNCIKRITFFCLIFTLMGFGFKVDAHAEDIDTTKRCDFKIQMDENGEPLPGVTFNIFKVADINPDGTFGAIDPTFADYKIDPQYKNKEDWEAFAYTLDMSIIRDGIPCDATRSTGSDGFLLFENLPTGLYLVSGLEYRHDNEMHEIKPFMVSLPTFVEGVWFYDVTSQPKCPGEIEAPEKITYNVIFLWDDEGCEDKRPKSVDIALMKIDNPTSYRVGRSLINKCYAFEKRSFNSYGQVVDTATVSAKNNWRYTWSGLDYGCEYDIVTEELEDYYITASYDRRTFIFRHRTTPDGSGDSGGGVNPDVTPDDENDGANPDGKPDGNSDGNGNPDSSNGSGSEKLPQTGQLWWPVPFMILVGLILCIFGIIRRRGDSNEE